MTGLDRRFILYYGSLVFILAQLLSVFSVHKYGYVLVWCTCKQKKVHLCVNIVIIILTFYLAEQNRIGAVFTGFS